MEKKKVLLDLTDLGNPTCGFGQIEKSFAEYYSKLEEHFNLKGKPLRVIYNGVEKLKSHAATFSYEKHFAAYMSLYKEVLFGKS